jgi:hypothetical protein
MIGPGREIGAFVVVAGGDDDGDDDDDGGGGGGDCYLISLFCPLTLAKCNSEGFLLAAEHRRARCLPSPSVRRLSALMNYYPRARLAR